MSNGCGCQKGVLRWFRPPYARLFYVPCCMHDDEYDRGGGKQERKKADRNLFYRMLRTVQQNETRPLRIVWLTTVALGYYACVRMFGRWYFNGHI